MVVIMKAKLNLDLPAQPVDLPMPFIPLEITQDKKGDWVIFGLCDPDADIIVRRHVCLQTTNTPFTEEQANENVRMGTFLTWTRTCLCRHKVSSLPTRSW